MNVSSYANIWNALVPQGYIVALPTTEGSFFPNHTNFAKDLAFVAQQLPLLSSQNGSLFQNRVSNKTCVMGHSMGGGAAVLAAQYNPATTVIAGLASAETNPSAIAAAASVSKPVLLFDGSNDCVTPPSTNSLAMYNNLNASSCKTFVSINGGNHCYFANYNFNCSFGELTCSPSATISRATQQTLTDLLLKPFLNHYLKSKPNALANFIYRLDNTAGITYQRSCTNGSRLDETDVSSVMSAYPNPTSDAFTVSFQSEVATDMQCVVLDLSGRTVLQTVIGVTEGANGFDIDCADWQFGVYFVYLVGNGTKQYTRVVKQ